MTEDANNGRRVDADAGSGQQRVDEAVPAPAHAPTGQGSDFGPSDERAEAGDDLPTDEAPRE